MNIQFTNSDLVMNDDVVFDLSVKILNGLFKNDYKSFCHLNSVSHDFDQMKVIISGAYFKTGDPKFNYITDRYFNDLPVETIILDKNVVRKKIEELFGKIPESEIKQMMTGVINPISFSKKMKLDDGEVYRRIYLIKNKIPKYFQQIQDFQSIKKAA